MPPTPAKPVAQVAPVQPEAPAEGKESLPEDIPTLIEMLTAEGVEQADKRRIRAKLRRLGHSGGAGLPRGRKPTEGEAAEGAPAPAAKPAPAISKAPVKKGPPVVPVNTATAPAGKRAGK